MDTAFSLRDVTQTWHFPLSCALVCGHLWKLWLDLFPKVTITRDGIVELHVVGDEAVVGENGGSGAAHLALDLAHLALAHLAHNTVVVWGRDTGGQQSRTPRETKRSREASREESVELGLSWHRRCSLLRGKARRCSQGSARSPPPPRIGARGHPLALTVSAAEHLQHPTSRRGSRDLGISSDWRSQHRFPARAHDPGCLQPGRCHSTGRMPTNSG